MYEWTCSPYDSDNNKYYLPYFGESSNIFQFTWQDSTDGVSYIYPINENELNCTGLVTALEFCYTTTAPSKSQSSRSVFNFLTLTRTSDNVFEVVRSTQLSSNPNNGANCMPTDPRRCCDVHEFSQEDQFNLSSPNFAFGFGPQEGNKISYQGLYADLYPMFTANSHTSSSSLSPGNSFDLRSSEQQTLRLAWLHIGKQCSLEIIY